QRFDGGERGGRAGGDGFDSGWIVDRIDPPFADRRNDHGGPVLAHLRQVRADVDRQVAQLLAGLPVIGGQLVLKIAHRHGGGLQAERPQGLSGRLGQKPYGRVGQQHIGTRRRPSQGRCPCQGGGRFRLPLVAFVDGGAG